MDDDDDEEEDEDEDNDEAENDDEGLALDDIVNLDEDEQDKRKQARKAARDRTIKKAIVEGVFVRLNYALYFGLQTHSVVVRRLVGLRTRRTSLLRQSLTLVVIVW